MPPLKNKAQKVPLTLQWKRYCRAARMPLFEISQLGSSWELLTFSTKSFILDKAWFLDTASIYKHY